MSLLEVDTNYLTCHNVVIIGRRNVWDASFLRNFIANFYSAKKYKDSEMGLVCLPWCSDLNGSDFSNTNSSKIYINKPNLCSGNHTMYKEFYLLYRCDTDHFCFNSCISQFKGVPTCRRTLVLPSVRINFIFF